MTILRVPALFLLLLFTLLQPVVAASLEILHHFPLPGKSLPAPLIQTPDGNFYGVTWQGGKEEGGTFFRMNAGGQMTTLAHFGSATGTAPNSLMLASDGNFYGSTTSGGSGSDGTLFRCTPAGELTAMIHFNGLNGGSPATPLVQGADGHLYGATRDGGKSDSGILFQLTLSGTFTILADFLDSPANVGSGPVGPLTRLADGTIYGTTFYGRSGGGIGSIFRYTPGSGITAFHAISGLVGSYLTSVILATDGNFYGTASSGGTSDQGIIFRVNPAGELTVLENANSDGIGDRPMVPLVEATDGNLYGLTRVTPYRVAKNGTVTPLPRLPDNCGHTFKAGFIQGSDGALYAGSMEGGVDNYMGAIFRMAFNGSTTVVNNFTNAGGDSPHGGLAQASDGTIYGVATGGGSNAAGTFFRFTHEEGLVTIGSFPRNSPIENQRPSTILLKSADGHFYGTATDDYNSYVFRARTNGAINVVHQWEIFDDSRSAHGPVAEAPDGNLYGVAYSGTIYRLTKAGGFFPLYTFPTNFTEAKITGTSPGPGLAWGNNGFFYGVTRGGGTFGKGTAFKIDTAGNVTILAHFPSNLNSPRAPLLLASDGNFYGVTEPFGASYGTVFRLTPDGALTTVVAFQSNLYPTYLQTRSSGPFDALTEGADGNFYISSTSEFAASNDSIFRMTKSGVVRRIHTFTSAQGKYLRGKLLAASDRALYGTTASGGLSNGGTLFRLRFGPSVTTLAATNIAARSAVLNASVNPDDAAATVQFEYGPTTELGSITPPLDAGSGGTVVPVSIPLENLLPGRTYFYRALVTTAAGTAQGATLSFTALTTKPTVQTGPAELISPIELKLTGTVETGGLPTIAFFEYGPDENYGQTTAEIHVPAFGNVTTAVSAFIPPPGAADSVHYRLVASNEAGQVHGADIAVDGPPVPASTVIFSKDGPVPGAGTLPGIPAESTWKTFGVPSINNARHVTFVASTVSPDGAATRLYKLDSPVAQPMPLLERGQQAPGASEGVLISNLKDPMLNERGDIAVQASLTGKRVNSSNNQAIFVISTDSDSDRRVARSGDPAIGVPAGAKWRKFLSAAFANESGNGGAWTLAFRATMVTGRGGVTANNDTGLWLADGQRTQLAVRKGFPLSGSGNPKKVKNFYALKPLTGATGQGHGVTPLGIPVQVIFVDNTQALVRVSLGVDSAQIETLAESGEQIPGVSDAPISKLGVPVQNSAGDAAAWITRLTGKTNPEALVSAGSDGSLALVARQGDPISTTADAPLFGGFSSVAVNRANQFALLGNLSGASVTKSTDLILARRLGDDWELVAREGEELSGEPAGARWSTFTAYGLGDETPALAFVGKLRVPKRREPNPAAISSANDEGLWVAIPGQTPHLILREGDDLNGKQVRSFTALAATSDSPMQRRSFAANGRALTFRVTAKDGSQHILYVRLPKATAP